MGRIDKNRWGTLAFWMESTKIAGELWRFGWNRQKTSENFGVLSGIDKNRWGTLAFWTESTKIAGELWRFGWNRQKSLGNFSVLDGIDKNRWRTLAFFWVKRTISPGYGAILG
nr:hypothetical protein [Mammaliicoccus sp. Marseille-Q6498]